MVVKRPKPIVIGLTGGIGSGKSTVLQTLRGLGAEGIDADQVAHIVIARNGDAYERVASEFGEHILAEDGQIDRKRLAQVVFADTAALRRLESIVHPAVADAIRRQVESSSAPMVVIEAIKLLEAGLSRTLCDQVWVTVARPEQQAERLIAGRGMSPAEIQRRLAAQMPPEEMVRQADRVIDTSGTLAETALQALSGWAELGLDLPAPEIRTGRTEDAEGVAAVRNSIAGEGGPDCAATKEEAGAFPGSLPHRTELLVAVLGGVVAGFLVVEPFTPCIQARDHVALMSSYVAAAVRSHGVEQALAATSLDRARSAGFEKIVVYVRADDGSGQAVYAGLGFRPCGRLAGQARVAGTYFDELIYETFLTEGPR